MYTGPERRRVKRPNSSWQRLLDITFAAARKIEAPSTEVPLTKEEVFGKLALESEAADA